MLPITLVRSATHLEIELVRLGSVELEFDSAEEQARYEKVDFALAKQIEAEVRKHRPSVAVDDLLSTNYDWWPNKARSLVISERSFCLPVVEGLAALLTGEYEDWKIHVRVCKSLGTKPDSSELGSLCILQSHVILESNLGAILASAA